MEDPMPQVTAFPVIFVCYVGQRYFISPASVGTLAQIGLRPIDYEVLQLVASRFGWDGGDRIRAALVESEAGR
jgi:hypothetical protein